MDGDKPTVAVTLAIFAKEPAAGSVKTRLSPPLTGNQAASICAAFNTDTVRKALAICPHPVVYYSGSAKAIYSSIRGLDSSIPLERLIWRDQGDGDLGARMSRVPAPCVIIGTDSPNLPGDLIREAIENVQRHDVVLVPAEDGGYCLIGLRERQPGLFVNMVWSRGDVREVTLKRAKGLGLDAEVLPGWYDIDTIADLRRLRDDLELGDAGRDECRCTRTAMDAMAPVILLSGP